MIPKQVRNEVFSSDAEWLDEHPDSDVHEIDREICLVFQDARADKFVSWEQVGNLFEIRIKETSFFKSPPEVVRDLSGSQIWRELIGRFVSIDYFDEGHLVLSITDGQHPTYCCSRESDRWGVDVVHVTNVQPQIR
jgi:hypothetical protein